jgi:hypothetical protein
LATLRAAASTRLAATAALTAAGPPRPLPAPAATAAGDAKFCWAAT